MDKGSCNWHDQKEQFPQGPLSVTAALCALCQPATVASAAPRRLDWFYMSGVKFLYWPAAGTLLT